MLDTNIILKTDSYKLTHWAQYPEGTSGVYSYFESRVGAKWPFTVFFGLQYLLEEYLVGSVIKLADVREAEEIVAAHLGSAEMFNREGWEYIVKNHGGHLPLRIKAVPEGTRVPTGNVLMTVESTDPECFWLTNYMETLLTHVWYPSTVATLSATTKDMIQGFLEQTADTLDALPFMLHDFGYRGVSSDESAAIGALAHLINFKGGDSLAAFGASQRYFADFADLCFSVPASEHSIMTALGREGEYDQLDRMLDSYPTGIVSVVADSYDYYAFVREVNDRAPEIMQRDGRVVVRPDSPTPQHKTPESLMVWTLNALWDGFGGTKNDKGFTVLDDHIRVLWGDGIGQEGIEKILAATKGAGFSVENLVFGMGGGLLQKVNRDTQRFAFKSSAQKRKGVWVDVKKEPLDASKASKAGRLKLIRNTSFQGSPMETVREDVSGDDLLVTVFENGHMRRSYGFDEVRANADA